MLFHQLDDRGSFDQTPFLRLLQHAPNRAQSVVRISWRTADLDSQHIVRRYLVEPHRDHLGRFEQSPAYPVVLSGWRLWGSIRRQGRQPGKETLGAVSYTHLTLPTKRI